MADRPYLLLLIAALVAASCSRTPPEPAPAATNGSESGSRKVAPLAAPSAPLPPSRCIAPVSSVAPVIPPPAPAGACPADPEPGHKMPMAEVTFADAPKTPRFEVELAKNPRDVEQGLMYRRSMPDDRGMLFTLDGQRDHTFWMHNTCISLDMLFVDDEGVIVGIVEGAAPLTDTTRSVGCPSSFVLELNGGVSRKRGIAPGQKMTIPSAARTRP